MIVVAVVVVVILLAGIMMYNSLVRRQNAVEQAFCEVDEFETVLQWLQRKYRTVNLSEYLQDPKHLASVYRKLRYAGFGSASSVRALKRYADRADELEDDEPE